MTWTESQIQAVWDKGEMVENFRPDKWRKDACGAWISRDLYDRTDSDFGWQISRVVPAADGGGDDLENLRPLQWKNKASRHGGELTCPLTAFAGGNVDFTQFRQRR